MIGHQHFAGTMDAEGLLYQQVVRSDDLTLKLDLERLTQNAERVVISVQRCG